MSNNYVKGNPLQHQQAYTANVSPD